MGTWIAILIIIGVILVLAFSAAGQATPPSDPFLSYADLLSKDQIIAGMSNRKFICNQEYDNEILTKCALQPDDHMFSNIAITLKNKDIRISFDIKKGTLNIGDLVLLWGMPDATSFHTLLWSEQNGVAVSAISPFSNWPNYLVPVWGVTFTFAGK